MYHLFIYFAEFEYIIRLISKRNEECIQNVFSFRSKPSTRHGCGVTQIKRRSGGGDGVVIVCYGDGRVVML